MKEQSAVDFLHSKILFNIGLDDNDIFKLRELVKIAKKSEKQQIIDAWNGGDYAYFYSKETGRDFADGNEYYNETYGSKGSDVPQLKYKDGTPIRSYDSPKIQEMVKLMNEDTYKVWECCGMEECICKGSDETKTK